LTWEAALACAVGTISAAEEFPADTLGRLGAHDLYRQVSAFFIVSQIGTNALS
jgi:hypothetical protein